MAIASEFGDLTVEPEDVYHFPEGLPAFETEDAFVLLEREPIRPILCLQSVRTRRLKFYCVPVKVLCPDYVLALESSHRDILGLAAAGSVPDESLLCLAILTFSQGGATTANLLSPVVLNRKTKRGCQVVQTDSPYSCVHALQPAGQESSQCW